MADHGGKDLGGSTGGVGRQMGFGRGEADGGRGEEEMGGGDGGFFVGGGGGIG